MPVLGGCSSNEKGKTAPPPDNTPSVASLHEGRINDLKTLLAKAPSLSPNDLREGLTSAKGDIASLNQKMEEEFQSTSEILSRLNLPEKQAIHEDVVSKYQASKDRLNVALDRKSVV